MGLLNSPVREVSVQGAHATPLRQPETHFSLNLAANLPLQPSSTAPGSSSTPRGKRWAGGPEGAGTPRQRHTLAGSIPASPSFSVPEQTRSWESGASLGRRCWKENHLQLQNPPPSFPPSISPIKFLQQDFSLPEKGSGPASRRGRDLWARTAVRVPRRGLRGFFLQLKLARDKLAPSFIKICQLPSLKCGIKEGETVPSTDAQ